MAITYTQANKILDYNFGASTYSVSSTLYFGLSTTTINSDGTGATEPIGTGYARIPFTNTKGASTWGGAASASLSNLGTITFTESTASWGTITYVFIADSLSGGNILYYNSLSSPKTVGANTTVYFGAGNVIISMTN